MGERLSMAVERLGGLRALDAVGTPLRAGVRTALPPGPLRDALRGRWLGHPLHPMLTDAPIGFWVSALVLDRAGPRARRGADLLIGLGLATSVPTAVAGLADWSESSLKARREGVVHALANVTALTLFAASLAVRRGDRPRGRRLALMAGAALAVGGYVGAHLSYVEGVGVSRRAAIEPATPPLPGVA